MKRLKPRKVPRQTRSKATVDAILEACARLLRAGDYARVTTNHIAERAGVGIGTLYEFFPNKESVVAALVERKISGVIDQVKEGVETALRLGERDAAGFLVRRIVEAVSGDRALYEVVFHQAPFVRSLTSVRFARESLFEFGRAAGERARHRMNLPHLEADTWLIGRMVESAVLEIAFLEGDGMDRRLLTDELVRLTFRMIQGRDLDDRRTT